MKKLRSLLAVGLSIILLSACGSNTSNNQQSSSSGGSAQTATDSTAPDSGESADTATDTVADTSSASSTADGVTEFTFFRWQLNRNNITYFSDTAWIQELEKRTNTKINFQGPAVGDDYDQAVNILLASNDYPDVLFYNWNKYNGGLRAAIDDGIVVNVGANDEYRKLMPTWFGLLDSNEMMRRAVTLDDGTSALFCHVEEELQRGAYMGYFIRKDWLDRIGKQVPTTIDELYDVLKAFKAEDANGNGDANDEIPLSDDKDRLMINTLAAAWGLRVNQPYLDPETGKMIYWTQYKNGEAFTDFITTLNKWYNEGLLDPEFASQEGSAREAKITSDRVGMGFAWTGNYAQWTDSIKMFNPENADKIDLYGMVPLKGQDGKSYGANDAHVRYAASNEGTVIMNTAEKDGKIEAILKLIDFMYTEEGSEIVSWGVEGVSYTKDANGKHQWTDAVLNDPEFSFNDKVFEFALPTWGSFPKRMSYEAWASIETTTPESVLAHENYWKADTSILMPPLMMNQDEAEEYNQIMTDADTAIKEFYVSAIMGTRSLDEIPGFLQTIEGMNVSRAMEIFQNVYDRYNSK